MRDEPGRAFRALDLLASHLGAERPREGWRDEHDRADLYRRSFDVIGARGLLLEAAVEEPVPSMQSWIGVQMIERVPTADFAHWLRLADDPYAARRAREVARLRDLVASAPFDSSEIEAWSDWLQRRAAVEAHRHDVLEALALHGRSKKVRAIAQESLEARRSRG